MKRRAVEDAEIVQLGLSPLRERPAIVAIPARNEADRISRCLAALAMQRDRNGAPITPGRFGVYVLVNNSADDTAGAARRLAAALPFPLEVAEVKFSDNASAGGARRRAMQEAALRLRQCSESGVLLTTDADSVVTPS